MERKLNTVDLTQSREFTKLLGGISMREHSDFCQLHPDHDGICSRAVGQHPRVKWAEHAGVRIVDFLYWVGIVYLVACVLLPAIHAK